MFFLQGRTSLGGSEIQIQKELFLGWLLVTKFH